MPIITHKQSKKIQLKITFSYCYTLVRLVCQHQLLLSNKLSYSLRKKSSSSIEETATTLPILSHHSSLLFAAGRSKIITYVCRNIPVRLRLFLRRLTSDIFSYFPVRTYVLCIDVRKSLG